ncbi:sugar transferase [Janibacter sp. G56]|uniref:sugar transferase n=1 Tax=Janibacter sp. G56 TaxID=3418717 RepID=UPI003D066CA2
MTPPSRGASAGASGVRSPEMRRLQLWLALTDLLVIVWATFGAQVLRFGVLGGSDLAARSTYVKLSYTTFSIMLVLAWWLALRVHGAYAVHLLGHGTGEYRLIGTATLRVFGAVAMLAYALKVDVARGYILLALPAGLVGLYVARRMWRRWLAARRAAGQLSHDVLVVGDGVHSRHLIRVLADVPEAGYRVVGACTSGETDDVDGAPFVGGVPVVGAEYEAARLAIELGVDVVACSSSSRLGPAGLRRLGWSLEGSGIELVVSPGLTDVAGPRVLTRPVAGLPLLHVEAPTFSGPKLALKTTIDWVGAFVLCVLLGLPLLVIAAIIKLQDGGPVFFRQQRVGLGGELFDLVKFRSMVVDAEARLPEVRALEERQRAALRAEAGEGARAGDAAAAARETAVIDRGVLFKMEDDPRVTPVGRFIRRYSIDELPQLLNVLAGQMSLVGPRPPLPSEVSRYEDDVRRRLLVKPGMTGLWQINGRSNLTWDESVRFDLYYVENWSVAQDLLILWRTLAAVVRKDGAY